MPTYVNASQFDTSSFENKVETAVTTGAASDDVVKKAGDTMTGTLNVPTVNLTSVNPSDTATFFGTDDSGNSTLHMRIGNGVNDKIQIESWNGSSATSLMEVGQTTVTIKGDLVVSGTTTTINSETLEVADNYIILNSGLTGSPTLDAGIRVERGSESDAEFKWNETEDKWEADNGLIVGGNIRAAVGSGLSDADEDTYITVEEIADENTIHFYTSESERVKIDNTGNVDFNKQSAAGMYLSTNQNISAGTYTKINLDTVDFDRRNEADTTNHRIVVNKSGIYIITAGITIDAKADYRFGVAIYRNGSPKARHIMSSKTSTIYLTISTILELDDDDYIEIYGYNEYTSDVTVSYGSAKTWLRMAKIS